MDLPDCVVFMLIDGDRVLAEKRKLTKEPDPGAIALPGGHMKRGESCEEALYRESGEELGITPSNIKYVCSLLRGSQHLHRLHYYAVELWEGEIECIEAECLLWIPLDELERLDIEVDRVAVGEYLRVYTG
jgi:8-oxo-dGTP diphosphatase